MEYNNAQFILFCLFLMLTTLAFALWRINSAAKRGETVRESSARWAILVAFVVCGLAFVNVAMDKYMRKQASDDVPGHERVHEANVIELNVKDK